LLSTLAICIVFVPVFLLSGVAKYLFSPLSLAVLLSLLASLVLSFTVVPVMFDYLILSHHPGHEHGRDPSRSHRNPFVWAHHVFNLGFDRLREGYRNALAWAVGAPWLTAAFFVLLIVPSLALFPILGRDFFPTRGCRANAPARSRPGREQD